MASRQSKVPRTVAKLINHEVLVISPRRTRLLNPIVSLRKQSLNPNFKHQRICSRNSNNVTVSSVFCSLTVAILGDKGAASRLMKLRAKRETVRDLTGRHMRTRWVSRDVGHVEVR